MECTFIGHASILLEANGVTVLSDPWWLGPCFGAQWWTWPKPYTAALDEQRIDYIYLSHGHHDHFHQGTLAMLPKSAKVLVSSVLDLAAGVRELGFEVIEVPPGEPVRLGGTDGPEVRIMPTHGDDTLMALSDGREVCLNLNDALHSAPAAVQDDFIRQLHQLYPTVDYVFCGYGVASHFPNCYVIPGKDAAATAAKRQAHFNREWVRLIAGLAPRFGFPFAADVVFLQDELFWVNEATHNPERPTTVFERQHPDSATRVVDIAPGFKIEDGQVVADLRRQPVRAGELRQALADQIGRANRVGRDTDALIDETVELLRSHLSNCRRYLSTFDGDYLLGLRFVNSSTGLLLEKRGPALSLHTVEASQLASADLIYATRWAYLRWALQRQYGDEILFVGSGGIFEYASRGAAERALHRELITLIRNQGEQHRAPPAGGVVPRAKRIVKRLLGREQPRDLYDLLDWTVFQRT